MLVKKKMNKLKFIFYITPFFANTSEKNLFARLNLTGSQSKLLSNERANSSSPRSNKSEDSEVVDLETSCLKCIKSFGTSRDSLRSDLECCKGHVCHECLEKEKFCCPWCKARLKKRIYYSHQDITPILKAINKRSHLRSALILDPMKHFKKNKQRGEIPFIDSIDCHQENGFPKCPSCTIL